MRKLEALEEEQSSEVGGDDEVATVADQTSPHTELFLVSRSTM